MRTLTAARLFYSYLHMNNVYCYYASSLCLLKGPVKSALFSVLLILINDLLSSKVENMSIKILGK